MIFLVRVVLHNATNGSVAETSGTGLSQTSQDLQEEGEGELGLGQRR